MSLLDKHNAGVFVLSDFGIWLIFALLKIKENS